MLIASLTALATLAGYAVLCAIQPFTVCRKCHGTGARKVTRHGVKVCRRCHGQRYRLRAGRRLNNHGRRIHHDGTRPNPSPRPRP
ncbi:hypothetical protein ACH429_22085 [Streptomyces pathocidini]|uniref:Uncharacterized protein n=1 Tax=Streptomyces pathocidini TaxID=1650571 RepID=A0ABW7UWD6_9ACTN|nr:hypothetical protein [Streptomyces pathocidini]